VGWGATGGRWVWGLALAPSQREERGERGRGGDDVATGGSQSAGEWRRSLAVAAAAHRRRPTAHTRSPLFCLVSCSRVYYVFSFFF
jgi:hypothetical protein